MNEKSKLLYELMLRKGYPGEFSRLVCLEMNTDFTAERMMHYVSGEKKRLEDVADEMVAIKDLSDRLINKHITEHANRSISKTGKSIFAYKYCACRTLLEEHSLRKSMVSSLRQCRYD